MTVSAPDTAPLPRAAILWLYAIAAMIIVMVALGGITRLTDSGLSIMEWNPILGALPPLSEAEWDRVFALYRGIAEYRHVNPDMTLAGFKAIFWWEYLHRLWGRLIGFAFLLPLLVFFLRRQIGRPFARRLCAIFLLGALQGAAGWFMVASGFADRIDVSQYRLVIHLLLAAILYAAILDTAACAAPAPPSIPDRRRRRLVGILVVLLFLQIAAGGLVAGTDAGFLYNDFPLMNGHWLSPDLFAQSPWWINFGESQALVQFQHRLLALPIAGLALWLFAALRAEKTLGRIAGWILSLVTVQIGLGIATLVFVIPLPLAVAHQVTAFLLLGVAVHLRRRLALAA